MTKRVNKQQIINVVLFEGGCIMYDHIEVKAYLLDKYGDKIGTINFMTYLKLNTKKIPYYWYDSVYNYKDYYII